LILTPTPLFKKLDSIHVDVPDLEAGLEFYRDKLGLALIWWGETSAGLKLGDEGGELVIDVKPLEWKTDLLVDSVSEATQRFKESGGSVWHGPFEIPIGQVAVVRDLWGNEYTLLDQNKGTFDVDADRNVTGVS
jgi:predicted enzyme related to lactoylglutathione lyase